MIESHVYLAISQIVLTILLHSFADNCYKAIDDCLEPRGAEV
jgi:hypothetical protein